MDSFRFSIKAFGYGVEESYVADASTGVAPVSTPGYPGEGYQILSNTVYENNRYHISFQCKKKPCWLLYWGPTVDLTLFLIFPRNSTPAEYIATNRVTFICWPREQLWPCCILICCYDRESRWDFNVFLVPLTWEIIVWFLGFSLCIRFLFGRWTV